jgi:hypothetical protein
LVTVKVTWPLASEGPLGTLIVELPPLGARLTVCPTTGALAPSNKVTVIVALLAPSAGTVLPLVVTVEVPGSVGRPPKFTWAVWVMVTASVSSVAV